jgi:hypothetical protein
MVNVHWLRVPEHIRFKITVLTFRALHRICHVKYDLRRIADIPSRGRLRSAATSRLDIRPVHLKMGVRTFASAGPRIWNSLPDDIINCRSLPVFRRKPNDQLFKFSNPDI